MGTPSKTGYAAALRPSAARLSQHASQRLQDRSIPPSIVDALIDFGDREAAGGGAETCFFTKRSWRRYSSYVGPQARHFERYRSVYLVVGSDGQVITACWRH